MWIWQQKNWPNFTWDEKQLAPLLRELCFNQGVLVGRMDGQTKQQKQQALDTLLANIIHSSAIEGEKLNAFSVRSSLAKKLHIESSFIQPQCKAIILQRLCWMQLITPIHHLI